MKNNKNKKIILLQGGMSSEREISLKTGKAVQVALKKKGYKTICIDVDSTLPEKIFREKNVKCIFNALHGTYGEDGRIQGMLDIIGIPYTGSGILASALAMNKIMSKRIFEACGLPTPAYQILEKNQKSYKTKFDYPIVVKPSSQGSACGVNIAFNKNEFNLALKEAFKFNNEILLEKYIPGRELTVGILGDMVLPVMEIVSKNKFYDYECKYTPGMSEHIVPAPLSGELTKKIQKLALDAHRCLGCEDYSRVDFRMDKENKFYILEVNTLPGMTDLSLFPEAAKKAKIEFPDLIEKIIDLAIKRRNGNYVK